MKEGECLHPESLPQRKLFAPLQPTAWLLLAALGAGLVLFEFEPGRSPIYPVCLFHTVTGYWCPGCGLLRAVHQLLHGHVLRALRLNALGVLMIPVAGWLVARRLLAAVRGRPLPPSIRPVWLWVALAAVLVFGVLRNLPWGAALAPPPG